MSKELFVSSTPHETKVAIVEEDQLTEVYFERENEYTLAGSIYKGRVTRVLPGMQSAFVNVALERDAFLYVSDFLLEEDEDADALEHVTARPYIMGPAPDTRPESRTEGPVEPIEAESIIPTYKVEMDAEPSHPGPAEDAPNGVQRGSDKDGPRRWKGRRRRGRGRDRFDDRPQDRPQEAAGKGPAEGDASGHDQVEAAPEEQHGPEFSSAEQRPLETVHETQQVQRLREARTTVIEFAMYG